MSVDKALTFGELIRNERLTRKIGLRQLAMRLRVSSSSLYRWEHDERNPSEEKIRELARIFKLNPDELLAQAGRVPFDLAEIIRQHPVKMGNLLRTAGRGS